MIKKKIVLNLFVLLLLTTSLAFAEGNTIEANKIGEVVNLNEIESPIIEDTIEDIIGELGKNTDSDIEKNLNKNRLKNKEALYKYIGEGLDMRNLNHRNAVIRFQADNYLVVDGIFGKNSKEAFSKNRENVKISLPEEVQNLEWFVLANKTKKILTVFRNGEIYVNYPIAVGAHSTATPDHKFTIINKLVDPYWGGMGGKHKPVKGGDPKNPLGSRWMGFSTDKFKGYGIHGNASPYSIGRMASAGCIRMINEDVESLFEILPIKTKVWTGSEHILKEWGVVFK